MIYFCADDYGISKEANSRIKKCFEYGALNKVSILPNGEILDFKEHLASDSKVLSLHINLVEGKPLSDLEDIKHLVDENGCFKHSFIGLFLKSFSLKRKQFEEEIYTELCSQIRFWKDAMGSETLLWLDTHQHTHMIPFIFKALMRAIKDEDVKVKYLRIPSEPTLPYLLTPSLYLDYKIVGIIKQWLLKFLFLFNKKELKKANIPSGYFIGIMFSGNMDERKIKKIIPKYIKLAGKKGKDIELCFHPGYVTKEELTFENRKDFESFYLSPGRRLEYDTLMNLKSDFWEEL